MGQTVLELEGGYQLKTSPDEMEAWIEVPPGTTFKDFSRLKEQLESLGLQNLLDPPILEEGRLIVARGKPPQDGEDGKIEFLVDFSQGPREISPHRVDWREVNALVSVPAGTPVARVLPPSPGIPGLTVWGEPVPPKPGKKVHIKIESQAEDKAIEAIEKELRELEQEKVRADLILGPGLKYEIKEGLIVAREGGFLELKERRLRLYSVYTLEGDVDWNTGNIYFHGKKLTINGSVKRGFKVESQGDLEIKGNIEDGAAIRAEGALFIFGIIKGERIEIFAGREAILNIAEYATLKVKGNLNVTGYLLQVRAIVGGMLSVIGEKGIIGGEIYTEGSATVSVVGSSAFVRTFIKVGYSYEVAEEVERLEKEFSKLDETTDKLKDLLVKGIRLAKAGKLSPEKKEMLKQLHAFLKKKIIEMADIKEKIKSLEEHIDKGEYAILQITVKAYPNVIVGIGKYSMPLKKEHGPGIFCLQGKKIIFRG